MPVEYLKESPSQTAGPYVHIGTMPAHAGLNLRTQEKLNVLTGPSVEGERIRIEGMIYDGARALVRELPGRIAPTRAAEHRVALFRLASSGISQAVNRDGKVLASAPYPGELASLAMNERTLYPTRIPPDRWLGRISAVVAVALAEPHT